jgi:hypothetical protein
MIHYARKKFYNIRSCSKSCEVKDRTPVANVIKLFQHNLQYCRQITIRIDIDYADCGVIMSIFIQLATDVNVIKLFSA